MLFSIPVLVLLAIVLIALFIWLLIGDWGKRREEPPVAAMRSEPAASPAPSRSVNIPSVEEVPLAPEAEDDLEIIEGIGPKIAATLKQAGVTSFAQLAAMEPEKISEILRSAGLRLADPKSWPEQARLAANGDMEGLKALQDRLTAGR